MSCKIQFNFFSTISGPYIYVWLKSTRSVFNQKVCEGQAKIQDSSRKENYAKTIFKVRRCSLWHLPGKQVNCCQVVPRLPGVLLWNSPDTSSEGSSDDEAQADRSSHLRQQSLVQTSQHAPGEFLQERAETCLYEMHREGPQRPWDCPHGEGEQDDQGEEEKFI